MLKKITNFRRSSSRMSGIFIRL